MRKSARPVDPTSASACGGARRSASRGGAAPGMEGERGREEEWKLGVI